MKKLIYGLFIIGTIGFLSMSHVKEVGGATEKPIHTVVKPEFTAEELDELVELEKMEELAEYYKGSDEYYIAMSKVFESDRFEMIDCNDLTLEQLENRNGKIIVEIIVGEVLDGSGNGRVINSPDGEKLYIHYDMEKFQVGDYVVSYCIYNPDTNAEDDILIRFDYKLE